MQALSVRKNKFSHMKNTKCSHTYSTHANAKSSFDDDHPQSSFSAHCVWAKSALHRDFTASMEQSS